MSRAPALAGGFIHKEKQPTVSEDEPRMNTNRHKD